MPPPTTPPPEAPALRVDNRNASIGQQINVAHGATFGDVHGPVTVVQPPAPATAPSRPRVLVLALSLATTLVAAILAFTTPGQRIACAAPGLRALPACDAHNPRVGELATWAAALAQPSGDGLRRYLHDYPQGIHADEADKRLQACTFERVESLGPERDATTMSMPINRASTFPSEEKAREDVALRAQRDAQELCKAYDGESTTLVSASLEPETFRCSELDDGFSCGAEGTLVCRIRDRIAIQHERCNDPGPDHR